MSVRIDLPVSVQCGGSDWWKAGGCGLWFAMSARADYSRRKEGREPVCQDCRFPPVIVVTEGLLDWWRSEGFTPESALELAEEAFGPRGSWPATIRDQIGGFTEPGFPTRMSA